MKISSKYAVVSLIIGFIECKSAIMIAGIIYTHRQKFLGEYSQVIGYAMSTFCFGLEAVKKYIQEQEVNDEYG